MIYKFRGKRTDQTGRKIGNILVNGLHHINDHGEAIWKCTCKCGAEILISSSNLNRSKGVGCAKCRNEDFGDRKRKHGLTDTRLHNIWLHMRSRCNDTTSKSYPDYGGRGITICGAWDDFNSFHQWATENGYSDQLTIERIDVNDNYCPENCKWATRKEQNMNKRNTKRYYVDGENLTLTELCGKYGVELELVKNRIKRGVDIKSALFTPKQKPFGFTTIHDNPTLLEGRSNGN